MVEPVAPEGAVEAHPVDEGLQTLRLGAVVGLASLTPFAHQPGELEDTQVLGHCGLRDASLVRQHPHGLFASAAQPLEDRPPRRIRKGLEEGVGGDAHARLITVWLLMIPITRGL